MNVLPCRSRTFRLELESVYEYVYSEYLHWLGHMTERLGAELALGIWNSALERFDLDFLNQILSSGWRETAPACALVDSDKPLDGILRIYFGDHPGSNDKDDAVQIAGNAPPLPQVREKLSGGPLQRATTTYEAIHLYCHGFALLAEALIDRLGSKGELLAYDIRLEEIANTEFEQLSVEEFIRRRRERFAEHPQEYDMHSAGLDVEIISWTEREMLTHTKECEWVRYYRERHPGVGYLMCCSVDSAAYRAINDNLRLQRTVTLMEGNTHCDFRIYAAD